MKGNKEMDEKRLTKTEFDILDILMNYYPKPVSITEFALEMRERGYDITIDEMKEILQKRIKK